VGLSETQFMGAMHYTPACLAPTWTPIRPETPETGLAADPAEKRRARIAQEARSGGG
jgi:hypothetical protein